MKDLLKQGAQLLIKILEDINEKETRRRLTSFETETKSRIKEIITDIRKDANIDDKDILG
jgi:hypothetical protein